MKQLLSIFAIIALVAMNSCAPKGVPQEEFDALSKQIVDKDTEIAQLQGELELLMADFDLCQMERDSLIELTTKKGGTRKTGTRPATTRPTAATTPTQQERSPAAAQQERKPQARTAADQKARN